MEDWEPGGKGLRDGKNDTCRALAARMSWQVWAMAGKSTRPRGGRRGWKARLEAEPILHAEDPGKGRKVPSGEWRG